MALCISDNYFLLQFYVKSFGRCGNRKRYHAMCLFREAHLCLKGIFMLKKVLLYILSACCLVCCALALTACKDTEGPNGTQQEQPGGWTLESAYAAACDLGYEGTLDEFLELIKGKDGADGTDGVDGAPGISVKDVYITESGHLMVVLSDDTEIDCGEIIFAAACKHEYTEWRLELEPTCASIGYSTRVCKLCGNREYDFIAAKGHSFGESKNIFEPICQEAGLAYSVCSECGIAELWEVKASGHKVENWIIEEYAHKGVCELCGETIEGEHDLASDGRCKECGVQCNYSLGLAYTIDKNEVTITGIGSCTDKDLVIPDRIEGLPVTAIGYCAFRYDSQLESISIPASVNYIGNCAFDYCKNLKGVYISDLTAWCNATIVRHGASWASGSNPLLHAGNLYLNGELVTELVIPDDVTTIQDGAFWGCTSIESIYIPAGVISINDFAFAECINISRITVSSDNKIFYSTGNCIIDRAKKSVFMGCKNSVIPADGSVTSIGREAFQYCRGLTNITIPNTISTISSRAFMYCENLTDLTIPYGVTYIGSLAFEYCKSLKSIVIPESVTHIGNQAFADCANLASITLPDSVTKLSSLAFSYTAYYYDESNWDGEVLYIGNHLVATKSTVNGRYTIKDGTLTVCDRAFSNRVGLTEIVVPSSVAYVGDSAFTYCENLKNAYYEGTPERWKEIVDFSNWVVDDYDYLRHATIYYYSEQAPSDEMADNYFWHYVDGEIVVWDSHIHSYTDSNVCDECGYVSLEYQLADGYYVVTGLGKTVASLRKDIHLYIPAEYNGLPVKIINSRAFDGSAITSVVIPETITQIGQYAFRNCKNLDNVVIPDSVTTIGDSAFYACSNLRNVTIGKGLNYVGWDGFDECNALENVYISDLAKYCAIDFNGGFSGPMWKAENLYLNGNLVRDLVIPEGVTVIECGAFENAKCLRSVTFPVSLQRIDSWAFSNCENIKAVYISDMAAWCGISFMNVGANPLNQNDIFSDKGNYLYLNGEPVIDLVIPEGVTSIGRYAFTSYDKLKSVTIPQTVTSIGNWAFGGWAINIEAVYISDLTAWCNIDFDDVRANPLYEAGNLYVNGELITDLVIPNGVTSVKNNVFAGGNFNSVAIPESVAYIGEYAFMNCKNLTDVRLPDGVTEISSYAFAHCIGLKSIFIPDSVTMIDRAAFVACSVLERVYYGGNAEQWEEVTIASSGNNVFATVGIYFYSEQYPYTDGATEGNFWHYVDGKIEVWVKEN